MAIDIENLAGFNQAGAPVICRGSSMRATPVAASSTIITTPVAVSLASDFHRAVSVVLVFIAASFQGRATSNVATVNINIPAHVDIVNIASVRCGYAQKTPESIPPRRPVPVAAAGGAADDREGRRGGADAQERSGRSWASHARHFTGILPTSLHCSPPSRQRDSALCATKRSTPGTRRGAAARGSRRWERPTCGLPSPIRRTIA